MSSFVSFWRTRRSGTGVLGRHARTPHVPSGVGDFVDVDPASDGGIAVSEQERNFVDALAGEQRAGSDRVPERVR
jgi:hypothetical protein